MMKHMKKAISFFMAVCLLAGNSYVNTEANTSVSMSGWNQVTEAKEPLLPKGLRTYLENNTGLVASAEETSDSGGYVFFNPTAGSNEVVRTGDEITISGSTVFLLTKVDENDKPIGFDSSVEIRQIISADENIAKIVNNGEGNNGYNITITAVSPGKTSVNVTIKETVTAADGSKVDNMYTFTCTVNVKMEIDKSDTHWKTISTDKKVLVLNQAEEYQVLLKGVENKIVNSNLMKWNWPNNGVIIIDESTGTIIPQGAGVVKISLKPTTSSQTAEEFTVIVSPTGTNKYGASYEDYKAYTEFATASDSFTLYTNGNPADNMTWEVYAITYNGATPVKTLISAKDTTLLTYAVSEIDGLIQFTGVKAGTYQVIGYSSTDKLYAEEDWNKVIFDITVNMTLQDTVRYLNVGDTFSILANSNLPVARFAELLEVDYIDTVNGPYVAGMDAKTGLITALNNGEVKVTVKYRRSPANSIYSPNDPYGNRQVSVTYTFYVIDEISLNTTSLNLYTGSTYQLLANVTDRTAPVTWKSSDDKLATVDATGLVTAKKATGTTPVQIIASQVIDGVEKSVTCNVYIQPAVTKVTLTPDNVVLKVDEYETIKAAVSPSGISGTTLHWLSSDTSIFQITDSSELTVTIQGKTGGTAVLTALNAENIVVGYCKVTVNQEAQGIKLSDTSVTKPMSHKTYQLYATLSPANTTNTKIIWDSQNTKIATVDQNGLVTFKNSGSVTISAQSADNPLLIAYCTFNIEKAVSGVELDYHDVEMYTGETRRLSFMVYPSNASHPDVIWSSFDTSVVAVDDTGMLTAKGPGKTQIMLMAVEDGSCYDICTVVVKQKATGVKMSYKELTMNRGEYFDMEVTVTPVNSTEASLIWESLSPSVATVSSTGRITARAAGSAVIAVRTQNGVTSYCTVTVIEPVISLELDPTELTLDVGEIFQIDPVFKPVEPSIKEVKWTSYNEDVATVNALGEVEGISRGSTIVTCETVDGGFRAFCLIQIMDPEMVVTITPDNYRLGVGKSIDLKVSVTNHGEEIKNVPMYWSSSDESICTVDQNGRVIGVSYGDAKIRAEVDDEFGAYAICEIRVVREVSSIRLNHTALTIIQGQSVSLNAEVKPSNASYTDAIFSSDDETIAVIDEDGTITALEPGTTWVWAKARDNSGKSARCYVTVIEPVPATGVTLSDKQAVLVAGESKKIVYTVKPANTTDDLIWSSANEAIATVNGSGEITAHKTGSTTITAMTSSGKTAQVEVIVIGLSRTTLELPVYTKYSKLTVDGATGTVRWDVLDQTICEVNNGVITARKAGTTYVTATVNGRTLRCKVTVTSNKKK